MSQFDQDRLENEKSDPAEAASLKFVNIPIVMLAFFVGFGVTYLALKTDDTELTPGDSRTVASSSLEGESSARTSGETDATSVLEKGKHIYTNICQACHQANGEGIPGVFPPLAASIWVTGSPKRFAAIVLHGLQGKINVNGQVYEGVMPPLKDQLNAEDIAAVTTYVRQSFGNQAESVSTDLVKAVAQETQSRLTFWDGESELNAHAWDD